jgi:hypothetical protein
MHYTILPLSYEHQNLVLITSYRSRDISETTEERMNMITEQGLPVQDDIVRSIPGVNQDSSDLGYSLATGSNAFVSLKQVKLSWVLRKSRFTNTSGSCYKTRMSSTPLMLLTIAQASNLHPTPDLTPLLRNYHQSRP